MIHLNLMMQLLLILQIRRNLLTRIQLIKTLLATQVLSVHTQDLLHIVTLNMMQHGEGAVALRYVATLVVWLCATTPGATGAVIATVFSNTMTLVYAEIARGTNTQKAHALQPLPGDTRCARVTTIGSLFQPARVRTRP